MLKKVIKKKLLLLIFILPLSSSIWAQGNLPYEDNKLIHFGISLGVNAMDFGITADYNPIENKKYFVDVSTLKPGFSVGIISDLRLNRYMNLRFIPTLHFGERELHYFSDPVGFSDSISITSIPICLPLYLKFSGERKGNFRPYFLFGAGVSLDLGRDKEKPVLLKPIDYYAEFGIGCDLYFSFFKLCPELKFAIGAKDMLTPLDDRDAGLIKEEDKKLSNALSKLTSRMITLAFNFE